MNMLKTSMVVALPALLAGYLAWFFAPCQPERSVSVPVGTKLLEFSPTGRYVVTFQPEKRELTITNLQSGQPIYATEIGCEFIHSVSHQRGFYGFSPDDRWLAVATGKPDHPQKLGIVDLESNNALIPVADLDPVAEILPPRPAFSSVGRFLSYFSPGGDGGGGWFALYDISAKREHMRIPGNYDSLGPPTSRGEWVFVGDKAIECWDINQKRRQAVLPLAAPGICQPGARIIETSITPDEQEVIALCTIESPAPEQGLVAYRIDLTTRATKRRWEYRLPASARLFWHSGLSEPCQLLLIQTSDDQENLVQDLVDIYSGKVIAHYPHPVECGTLPLTAGFAQPLIRTGEIVIDTERKVLVSTQTSWPFCPDDLVRPLASLGVNTGPSLHLEFHSAETGKLLERVPIHHNPYDPYDPALAMHPTESLLAVIDEKENEARLQFWRVPPPRPWGWIVASALTAGVVALLLRIGWRKSWPKADSFKKA